MAILKNISWDGINKDTILYKFPIDSKDQINKGSALTVREGQVAIFIHKGKLADVYLPGFYKLDTDNMPVLTKLMSWKYGFQTPFKADIFFVSTQRFIDQKWGTVNPIIIRDAEYGAVRVRSFGTFSFRITDAYDFMTNVTGHCNSYNTSDITKYLRSILLTGMTDTLGESALSILDMASNLMEMGEMVREKISNTFSSIGIEISNFNIQSFTLPEALEKAMDENASLNMLRKNMDVYQAKGQVDAMKTAAANTGSIGGFMGAGIGMSMGQNMANNMNKPSTPICPHCNSPVAEGAKFCGNCGNKLKPICPNCGKESKSGTKFCPDCGTKL